MNTALAEQHLLEYYGEKMDAQEADDYWPFVCIPLTSPMHVFNEWVVTDMKITDRYLLQLVDFKLYSLSVYINI